jgi:hypothetical protein
VIDGELARYQEALMELFAREGLDDEEHFEILREAPAFTPYATYVEEVELRFVALGAELLRKWGRREESERT